MLLRELYNGRRGSWTTVRVCVCVRLLTAVLFAAGPGRGLECFVPSREREDFHVVSRMDR